jgi:tRNA A-37 threonylcarbamoyl transferase component Bud32
VYDAYIDESIDRGVIVMEYIEGDVLREVWEDMTDDEQEGVISQLRGHMEELRGIKAMGRRLEE